jgi:kumamolisin
MSDRKVFHDSVVELPEQPGPTPSGMKVNTREAEQNDDKVTVSFALAVSSAASDELESRVAKGEVVPLDELNSKYAVAESAVAPLVAWLKKEGFQVTHIAADRSSVAAKGSISQIEHSLGVQMVRVTQRGITYNAARNAPSLPSDIAASVSAIGGLQPFRHAQKHFRRITPKNRADTPVRTADVDAQPSPNIANAPPYLVSELLKAYGADNLGLTGHGQVIAILIDTVPSDADLQAFWQRNGISASIANVTKINVNAATLPPAEGEETLDAEWSSGVAPGASIRIYASGSLQFTDLDRALDRITADLATFPTMRQLSISLGLGETFMQPAEIRTQHAKYLRLAAAGVNVFISTGDAGSNPDNTGHGSNGPLQVEYGSSDTAVIGVGGTSLALAANGQVRRETGWPDGGGGRSTFFARPVWQKGHGVPTGTNRLVPDVSLSADPNDGALVIFNNQAQQIGGTSWSAPVWAGFCALINEARAKAGKPALPFLNPLLYPLLGTACFRDIVAGSNGAFHAGPGYDMVTGLGVPNVRELVKALTA